MIIFTPNTYKKQTFKLEYDVKKILRILCHIIMYYHHSFKGRSFYEKKVFY